ALPSSCFFYFFFSFSPHLSFSSLSSSFFFFNDPATPEFYTLSLHDALPISFITVGLLYSYRYVWKARGWLELAYGLGGAPSTRRSEEHTSELQSLAYLVCRLLLEKKKKKTIKK